MGVVGTAAALYGAPSAASSSPAPAGGGMSAGAPSPAGAGVRTTPSAAEAGIFGQPTLWLVLLLAAAIGLVGFSLRIGK